MGDVDQGDTITDFMIQERERGITIQSACISFSWNGVRVNLIDTPGHVDFTVEVERSMRVMDGAVVLIDAVSGVQAQTEAVWAQADRYAVARIVLVNKMDLEGASLDDAIQSLKSHFDIPLLVLHRPIGKDNGFCGVIDVISMTSLVWELDAGTSQGEGFVSTPITPDSPLYAEAQAARLALIETCAEIDEALSELYVLEQPVSAEELHAAVRRAVQTRKAAAVLCASAYRKRAVQPAMDAMVSLLPAPEEAPPPLSQPLNRGAAGSKPKGRKQREAHRAARGNNLTKLPRSLPPDPNGPLAAFAFKITDDAQRGSLVFCRVYSGVLRARMQLLNTSGLQREFASLRQPVAEAVHPGPRKGKELSPPKTKERVNTLLRIRADETSELKEAFPGDICACVGLVDVRTGDTLTALEAADPFTLPGIPVPEPVFFCAIEPENDSHYDELMRVLRVLHRDDPSFQFDVDPDTEQLLLKGLPY